MTAIVSTMPSAPMTSRSSTKAGMQRVSRAASKVGGYPRSITFRGPQAKKVGKSKRSRGKL